MRATRKLMLWTLVVWQGFLGLLAALAARILIWAREHQILAERAAKGMLLAVIATVIATTLASEQITPSADAYINTAERTTDYGSSALPDMEGSSETAYIQFNLASIPRATPLPASPRRR